LSALATAANAAFVSTTPDPFLGGDTVYQWSGKGLETREFLT
jgi:hypothetical protein